MTSNRNVKMISNKKLYEYVLIDEMHMYKLVTVTMGGCPCLCSH